MSNKSAKISFRRLFRVSVTTAACCLLSTVAFGQSEKNVTQSLRSYVQSAPATDGEVAIDDMIFNVDRITRNGAVLNELWPEGAVPYIFDSNVSPANQQVFLNAVNEWSTWALIKFLPRTNQTNYVRVLADNRNGAHVGVSGGEQVIRIKSWDKPFKVVHEIGHALGLIHEHQRTDRDAYVQVNWNNIDPGKEPNFHIDSEATPIGPYDFYSVMHYDRDAFDRNDSGAITLEPKPQFSAFLNIIGQRDYISVNDRFKMSQLYGANDDPFEPNNDAASAFSFPAGQWLALPGEFANAFNDDFYRVDVATGGSRIVATLNHLWTGVPAEEQLQISIQDAVGNVLATATGNTQELLDVTIGAPGSYFIVVNGATAGTRYNLHYDLIEANPTIVVTYPYPAAIWIPGYDQRVEWNADLFGTTDGVRIEIWRGGAFVTELGTFPATDGPGSATVRAPHIAAGLDYKIRVVSASNPAVFDEIVGNLRMLAEPVNSVADEAWVLYE